MIGIDLPKGIYHVRAALKTEDLFLSPADGELPLVLNVLGVGKVQGSKSCLGQICQEDIPPFAKIGVPHLVACLQIGG